VVEAFRQLPQSLGAKLVILGQGPAEGAVRGARATRASSPRLLTDRTALARWLAAPTSMSPPCRTRPSACR
jgi:hypothetical protein